MKDHGWFEVGAVRLSSGQSVRIRVTQDLVQVVHDHEWELDLTRPQALHLSQVFETAVSWWPPRREAP